MTSGSVPIVIRHQVNGGNSRPTRILRWCMRSLKRASGMPAPVLACAAYCPAVMPTHSVTPTDAIPE